MTPREWTDEIRAESRRLDALQAEIGALHYVMTRCLPSAPRHGGGHCSGATSDPTAAAAAERQRQQARIAELSSELRQGSERVGYFMGALFSMRHALPSSALALEIWALDGASTWSEVACEMGVSLSTVKRHRDQGYAWILENVDLTQA